MTERMENRRDLASIIPFLPVVVRSSSLFWPPQVVERLKDLSRGPDHSGVDSGELLFLAILRIGSSLPPPPPPVSILQLLLVSPSFSTTFSINSGDLRVYVHALQLLPPEESRKWFREVVPAMANLVLRLPSLLETHYQNADSIVSGVETGLRLLGSQEPGIVFLNQELIGALLAFSFFCLFPIQNRYSKDLPTINFDKLFENLYECYDEKHENKIKCIIHYFERICLSVPAGFVSFERKILPLEHHLHGVSYPKADFWSKSVGSLCRFEVHNSGLLEDHFGETLEVDFANRYIGGGALRRGCVQVCSRTFGKHTHYS